MSKTAILNGVTELGAVTIENATIAVELDAGTDNVMVASQTGGVSGKFYDTGTTTNDFADNELTFGFKSQGIMVRNDPDSAENIEVSFDGIDVHDTIVPGEKTAYDNRHATSVFIRSASGGMNFEVGAW